MASDQDPVEAIREAIFQVSVEQEADVIVYGGEIKPYGYERLAALVDANRENKNVLLLLTTNGGSPHSAYRIARHLQLTYASGNFILFVGSWCKSAGTLIAIGANTIVMSESSELGPLDIQIAKPDALAEQESGLTPSQAMETLCEQAFDAMEKFFLSLRFRSGLQITTRTALEISAQLTTGLFSPIFGQIDPMRLGEVSRAMLIGTEYGKRLSRDEVTAGALDILIKKYPSHDFVIDYEEAKELFQEKVRKPTEAERNLARLVWPLAESGLETEELFVEFLSAPIIQQQEESLQEKGESSDDHEVPQSTNVPKASGGDTAATDEDGSSNAPSETTGDNHQTKTEDGAESDDNSTGEDSVT